MPEMPELLALLKAGVHFGHQQSKWHPKMAPFIFGVRNGVHVINLEKTAEYLKAGCDAVREVVAEGGVVLFVGTKRQAVKIVRKHAESCLMPYVNERWLGGTLTNFGVVHGLVKKLLQLEDQEKNPDYEKKYTKWERQMFSEEQERLQHMVGGIRTMTRLPQMVFVLDIKEEKTAIAEAHKVRIPVIAVCDSNANPEIVSYPIPANDDATKAIDLVAGLIAQSVNEGRAEQAARAAQKEKEKEMKKVKSDKQKEPVKSTDDG